METKVVSVSKDSKLYEIQQNSIFLWKCIKEEERNSTQLYLTFSRDDSLPYIDELRKLEKEFYKASKIPTWGLVISAILAVGFFSAFILTLVLNKEDTRMETAFPVLILPAIIFTVLTGVLGIFRTKDILKYINESSSRFDQYKERVNQLIENSNIREEENK